MNKTNEIKQKILSAAGKCFARYGFEKTTLENIGKQVGLNKASLYYYYQNKEAIFIEVVRDEIENFIQTLKEKIKQVEGCQNKIITYLTGRLDCYKSSQNLRNLSNESFTDLHDLFNPLRETKHNLEVDIIAGILNNAVKSKEIEPIDAKKTARNLITISDAIKMREIPCNFENNFSDSTDYTKVKDDIEYMVSLMFKGIIRK